MAENDRERFSTNQLDAASNFSVAWSKFQADVAERGGTALAAF